MMFRSSKQWIAWALVLGLVTPGIASATNGYFLIGYGNKSRAMGGVGVALGQDGLAAASNPAAMMMLKKTSVDVAVEAFVPKRSAAHNSETLPANEKSGQNFFLIPSMGGVYKFNRKLRMGMAVVGAGAGTRYSQRANKGPNGSYFFNFNNLATQDPPPPAANEFGRGDNKLGVLLIQMQALPSLAYKFNKNHSFGFSLALATQAFRARGLNAFRQGALGYSSGQTKLTDNGVDWAFGAGIRLGWLGQWMKKRLSVGLNYSSKVYMTEFKEYSELFAEKGRFDIPENFAIGSAFKVTDKLTVAMDIQRYMYSNVRSIANPGPNAYDSVDIFGGPKGLCPLGGPKPQSDCLTGADDGLGFGWEDQTVYKIGLAYRHNDQWTFRAGYNHGDSPIPEDQVLFNMLAPATVEDHVTVGFSYRPDKKQEISVSYMHAFENTIKGPTPFPPVGVNEGDVKNGSISMYQDSLGIQWGMTL